MKAHSCICNHRLESEACIKVVKDFRQNSNHGIRCNRILNGGLLSVMAPALSASAAHWHVSQVPSGRSRGSLE